MIKYTTVALLALILSGRLLFAQDGEANTLYYQIEYEFLNKLTTIYLEGHPGVNEFSKIDPSRLIEACGITPDKGDGFIYRIGKEHLYIVYRDTAEKHKIFEAVYLKLMGHPIGKTSKEQYELDVRPNKKGGPFDPCQLPASFARSFFYVIAIFARLAV